jgi:hypothetical protein
MQWRHCSRAFFHKDQSSGSVLLHSYMHAEETWRPGRSNHRNMVQGDANVPDDRGLYAEGQSWLNERHIIGRVIGYVIQLSFSLESVCTQTS